MNTDLKDEPKGEPTGEEITPYDKAHFELIEQMKGANVVGGEILSHVKELAVINSRKALDLITTAQTAYINIMRSIIAQSEAHTDNETLSSMADTARTIIAEYERSEAEKKQAYNRQIDRIKAHRERKAKAIADRERKADDIRAKRTLLNGKYDPNYTDKARAKQRANKIR